MMTLNKAGEFAVGIAIVVAVALWKVLRFALFMVLMMGERIVTPVLGAIAGIGLFGFLSSLVFWPHTVAVWAFFWTGLGATALLWIYTAVLMTVAPDGYVIVTKQ